MPVPGAYVPPHIPESRAVGKTHKGGKGSKGKVAPPSPPSPPPIPTPPARGKGKQLPPGPKSSKVPPPGPKSSKFPPPGPKSSKIQAPGPGPKSSKAPPPGPKSSKQQAGAKSSKAGPKSAKAGPKSKGKKGGTIRTTIPGPELYLDCDVDEIPHNTSSGSGTFYGEAQSDPAYEIPQNYLQGEVADDGTPLEHTPVPINLIRVQAAPGITYMKAQQQIPPYRAPPPATIHQYQDEQEDSEDYGDLEGFSVVINDDNDEDDY